MAVSGSSCLLDTNILVRLTKRDSPEFSSIREALRILDRGKNRLCYTSQNLVEFWNVSTRPIDKNGHGLSAEWRRLVMVHAVSGVQVHDARLVAAMKVHGIQLHPGQVVRQR